MIPGNNIPSSNIAFFVQQAPQPIMLVQTTPNLSFPLIQQPLAPPPQQQLLIINNNTPLVYTQPHIMSTHMHQTQPTLNMAVVPQQFPTNANHNLYVHTPTQIAATNIIPTMPPLPTATPSVHNSNHTMLRPMANPAVEMESTETVNVARSQNQRQTQSHASQSNPKMDGDQLFECTVCGKKYKYLCNYKLHYKIHTDDCYKCSFCGKRFGRKSNYKEHERIHTGEAPYECTFCSKRFKQRHGWMSHLRRHTGEKPYHCDICGEQFSVRQNLSVHKRTHVGQRPFQCHLCHKAYRQQSVLNSHITNVHQKASK